MVVAARMVVVVAARMVALLGGTSGGVTIVDGGALTNGLGRAGLRLQSKWYEAALLSDG